MAQLLFSQSTSWRRDSAVWTVKVCGAGIVGSTPTASTNKENYTMRLTCSQCERQIAGAHAITVIMGNDLYVFCDTRCKHGKFYPDHPVLGSWLETPTRKNPFCRRSGKGRRSGRERRISLDSRKYYVDRRGNGEDRRKGRDRRKHDYWNTTG